MPITSPVERISGPRTRSASGKRLNGSTASLTATWPLVTGGTSRPSARSSARVAPSITRAATFTSGTPVAFATNGTVREARGFASITNTWLPLTAYCTLMRPRTSRASAMRRVCSSITPTVSGVREYGGQHAGGVAGVDAGLLDVLHDAADQHLAGGVADGVDVDLGGLLEEAVDQHRALGGQPALAPERPEPGQLGHRLLEVGVVVDDLHGPTAEHVAGPHEHRVPDPCRDRRARRRRSWRCRRPAAGSPAGRRGRSTGRGPRRGRSRPGWCRGPVPSGSRCDQLQRRLPAEGDDHAGQRTRWPARPR